MFKSIEDTLDFIENQRSNNTSLEEFKKVFATYDNFQQELQCVHVTGTNGKGSTSKLLHDVLMRNKLKIGLFTSPHMIVANDRIRINNDNISDEDLMRLCSYFYEDIRAYNLNFFQIYTLISLRYFYEQDCDLVILEVGIGGLFDSTNVISSVLSIITNIEIDHTEKLGKTKAEIAVQKAGIIKANQDVVTMVEDEESLALIRQQCDQLKARLHVLKPTTSSLKLNQRYFMYEGHTYTINTPAKYQVYNAQIVLKALDLLRDRMGVAISEQSMISAFENFVWMGRFEIVDFKPLTILDGAHNVAGIKTLCDEHMENTVVIFSALRDKEYLEMIELLKQNFDELVFCEFDFYRALKKEDLCDVGIKSFNRLEEALDYYKSTRPNHNILICGSLYFISEVRKFYKGE